MQSTRPGQERAAAEDSPRRRGATLAPWQASRVARHVEAHLDDPLRVAELANLVRLGLRQFSAAFRGSFGQAPHSYLLERRVHRACELMAMTREPLSQIAVLCGFADQAHLTRIFRSRIGVPPNAWRRPRYGDGAAAASARRRISPPRGPGVPPWPQDLVQALCGTAKLQSEDDEAVRKTGIGAAVRCASDHGLPLL
jgi:AraC-like DNA-binding protein